MRNKPLPITDFSKAVMKWVRKIPRGRVATYGQIARLAGKPQGARGVGWILNSCSKSHQLPWHRVLNSQGKISFHPKSEEFVQQRKLLQAEGVEFVGKNALDLAAYQWRKDIVRKARSKTEPRMFS